MSQVSACRMVHHGAAASSTAHCLVWMAPAEGGVSQICYASHGILNLCQAHTVHSGETVWTVVETLRSSRNAIITSLSYLGASVLLCGFSDGSITLSQRFQESPWKEQVLLQDEGRAVIHVDGYYENGNLMAVKCSSDGVFLLTTCSGQDTTVSRVASYVPNVVRIQKITSGGQVLVLVGTAAPRHNKIHSYSWNDGCLHHVGSLAGHEDWITSLAWNSTQTLLASGSQDAKIRLWCFSTTKQEEEEGAPVSLDKSMDFDDSDLVEDDDEEGEARLEWSHAQGMTRVTLEALLFGHEEAVTSIQWHPNPSLFGQDEILISSSMDRTLLIWSNSSNVWTPLTRVGASGGILGGSIGSSLVGFVDAVIEPITGKSLVGHAYGGALHVWSLEQNETEAAHNTWRANPCITGHFNGITDLCWEAESGEYLLTASLDQTCRLWGSVPTTSDSGHVWLELARPQVHGYDLTAITSVSTSSHRHLLVSGADEKEVRVFDAPMSTVRILEAACGYKAQEEEEISRPERAYIPSLGLSNKATATEGAEADIGDAADDWALSGVRLPLERDLGAVSLWPEIKKLFGHNTELFCLASTVSARSGPKFTSSPFACDLIVASSTKAREVKDAAIRLWDVEKGKCIQVLSGGHRSTVAALSFSPDGAYLASSGKDRRLCLWQRESMSEEDAPSQPSFSLASAVDSAHKRIVWGVHFCPYDPSMVASCSRDGSVKIWKVSKEASTENEERASLEEMYKFESSSRIGTKAEAVTALSFAPKQLADNGDALLAIGLECGFIELWAVPLFNSEASSCQLLFTVPATKSHKATVSKLAWRPTDSSKASCSQADAAQECLSKATLASCSLDHGCRIFDFDFGN